MKMRIFPRMRREWRVKVRGGCRGRREDSSRCRVASIWGVKQHQHQEGKEQGAAVWLV
jgi:hypothetical protein